MYVSHRNNFYWEHIIKRLEGENGVHARHNINLTDSNQNLMFLINGHGRGAAIANLLCAYYIYNEKWCGCWWEIGNIMDILSGSSLFMGH